MLQNPIPDKIPIIPENVIGMPTSPPKSGNPKPKLANPTTINKIGIILLIICDLLIILLVELYTTLFFKVFC